jgi:alginate O-acetyltransferase complex protein AlgJ
MSNTSSPDVARGSDGTLFLIGGKQHVLPYLRGDRPLHKHVIGGVRSDLMKRKTRCDRMGAAYTHIVAPDKHSVFPDIFPYKVSVNVGAVYKDACGDLFDFPVASFERLGDRRGYMHTGCHWNADGMVEFVRIALTNLGIGNDDIASMDGEIERLRYETYISGDIGRKLAPKAYETAYLLHFPHFVHIFSNNVVDNNWKTYVTINPQAPLDRLLVFGDSFALSCLGLLSLYFREILMVRSTNFHTELLGAFHPTHVLTENVERYLPSMKLDQLAPNALVAPFLMKKEMAPDERFYEALNAVLKQGTRQHDNFISSLSASAATHQGAVVLNAIP